MHVSSKTVLRCILPVMAALPFAASAEAASVPSQPHLLVKAMILIVISTLFFYVPNLWLLWPLQGVLVVILTFPYPPSPEFRNRVSV